jgi:hypothetical protein
MVWMAEHGNIVNTGGLSIKTWNNKKTTGEAGNWSEKSVRTWAKWYQNDEQHSRNMDEEESKETMENCGQEVAQAESGVDRLLTRSKKQKWKNSVSVLKKRV